MIWHTFFQPFIEFGFMRRALVVCLALSLSTTMLGVFLLLRRMSLMGDALSHAILPGVAVGYLLSGMSLLAMTLGGFIAGIVVALVAGWVSRRTPLKEDASFAGFYLGSLALGVTLGVTLALGMILSPRLQRWLMPLVLTSQAIPVFALAPLLVLWLGCGMSAKVAMAVLVIFFPVTSAFFDGLRRVTQEYLDLARSMNASFGAQLRHVRLMAALPALGSGLRMAAAVAPIGAIIGEWVGSAEGLGYVMLNANARLQTDICFAALFILVLLTLLLWLAVDTLLHRLIDWSPE